MPARPNPRPRKGQPGRPARKAGPPRGGSARPARGRPTGGAAKRAGGTSGRPGGRTGGPPKRSGGPAKRSGGPPKRSGGVTKRSGPARAAGPPGRRAPATRGRPAGDGTRARRPGDDRRGSSRSERPGRDPRDDDRRGRPAPRRRPEAGRPEGRAGGWGGVARRGAGSGGSAGPKGRVNPDAPSAASAAFRGAAPEPWEPERFEQLDDGDIRRSAEGAVGRGRTHGRQEPPARARGEVAEELSRETNPAMGAKLAQRVADAARAYERERYDDARRILLPLARQAPGSPIVRELLGLVWYRLGRWGDAVTELEAFRSLTGSTEQHPVLADSYRALRRYDQVESLWAELREASPSAELVAEGRIVAAGSLADRGDLAAAIALIGPAVSKARRPRAHQLRLLYVLADLYERAGDIPRARTLFDRVLAADGAFADAPARRRALG